MVDEAEADESAAIGLGEVAVGGRWLLEGDGVVSAA